MDEIFIQLEPYLKLVRPFTRQIPDQITKVGSQIIGPLAFQRLIIDLNFTADDSMELLKFSLSKIIGLGIISASSVVKLPQIFAILKNKDLGGISFLSCALEALNYIITCSYNFKNGNPFSTFGETALLFIQNIIIMILIIGFAKKFEVFQLFFAVVIGLVWILFAPPSMPGSIGSPLLSLLFSMTIPLSIMSKIPQIFNIFKQKSTGQLSGFSVLNYNLGSLARIFTTLANHIQDNTILAGYVIGGVLNMILGLQMIYYGLSKGNTKLKKE